MDHHFRYERLGADPWGGGRAVLEQIGYRRTLLLEVELPEPHAAPQLAAAINFFADAQRRFLEGQYRGAVEHLRQVLAALVGADPGQEDDDAAVKAAIKSAHAATRARSVEYLERFELVRSALKFLTDLAAHPENGSETTATDARAAMVMTAMLLQWYSRPTGTTGPPRH